LAYILHFR